MRTCALLPPLAPKLLSAFILSAVLAGVPAVAQNGNGGPPTVADCMKSVERAETLHLAAHTSGYLYAVLASAYQDRGDFEHSRAAYERGLQLLESDPAARADYATALDNFGSLYLEFGQVAKARELRERAFRLRRESGSALEVAFSQEHIAEVELASHRYRQAGTLAATALTSFGALRKEERGSTATAETELSALVTLVYAEGMRGHRDASLKAAQEASRMVAEEFGNAARERAHVAMARGFAEWKAGRNAEADATLQEGLRLLREQAGERSPLLLEAMYEYRDFLQATGSAAQLAALNERLDRMKEAQRRVGCTTCTVGVQALR